MRERPISGNNPLVNSNVRSSSERPGEVIVKNDDPAVIFHEGTDFTEQISKVGEIVDRQVAQTQIKLTWAPKRLADTVPKRACPP